ncbi:hypothetical protein Krac_6404 [Ktedonobacter racemifer DSM 44963]|uniref:Uncharacterized protein n=1 Tax=Ktedonobacter racemifer DSM 44963 TaxID=485913 RepID=D6TUC9_KTERA|nr:hypothetical protein Krac_6404 [Ktedonobacter racemifer DSM 44963]
MGGRGVRGEKNEGVTGKRGQWRPHSEREREQSVAIAILCFSYHLFSVPRSLQEARQGLFSCPGPDCGSIPSWIVFGRCQAWPSPQTRRKDTGAPESCSKRAHTFAVAAGALQFSLHWQQ